MNETATLTDIEVSMYKNSFDTKGGASNLGEVMNGIKNGKWKTEVEQVRRAEDKKERDTLKLKVPAFSPSGVFSERKTSGLISHSNRIAIDFDLQDNAILGTSLEAVREALEGDQFSEYVFKSVSGKGLCVIVKIDGGKHAESFAYLERYYKETYGLTIDKACKDVSRLRYVSYDSDLFHNPDSEKVIIPDAKDLGETREASRAYQVSQSDNKSIMDAIIQSGKLIGDDTYQDWIKIGFALSHEFGETGRQYFHALSQRSPKYDQTECDKKFDNCLRTNHGDITFATIVHMAKAAGIDIQSSMTSGGTFTDERPPAKAFNLTDLGNAKRLVFHHGGDFRHCHRWNKWLIWNGKIWSIDDTGQIVRLAKESVKSIYREASNASDELREKVGKWAIRSESAGFLNSMVSLAQTEEGIPISPNELDTDPYLLNCKNGTINLRTGDLLPHNPKHFITKIIPVEYYPKAECPIWIEFLETIFNWNYDLINFIQRTIGYSLTGDASEQCLFLLHGTGANGKSTFLGTVKELLGDYAQTARFETFLLRDQERISNDLARMQGKRFITSIEAEGERRLSEAVIKQLTGQDTITARFLYGEYFEFPAQFKLWLACNHKPIIRGTDHAIWRRIKLIPFNVTIPENKQDKLLDKKLKAEFPGILAWAVQGCLEWQKNGLQTPDEVKAATNDYRNEMDVIQTFIDECCFVKPGSTEVKTISGVLYGAYKNWCEQNGEHTLDNRTFGRRMSEKGMKAGKSSGKNWCYGIGLIAHEI